MAKHSHKSSEPVVVWDLVDELLVECPKCAECALVRPLREHRGAKLSCAACGFSQAKEAESAGPEVFDQSAGDDTTDPFFLLPLWLRTDCAQHVLAAYNADHLTFLKRYFSDADRLRPPPERYAKRNRMHEDRLPKWMKRARNRDAIVAALSLLDARLAEASRA
jgi:Zn ribbon nucleic-acid-binding protein